MRQRTYQGLTTPPVNLEGYDFEPINRNIGKFLEELFLNAYVDECHESEPAHTTTNKLQTIIDTNYKKADLHKTINKHHQHLAVTEQE